MSMFCFQCQETGDLGDKTKLPVNKGAIETLIGDDAQFYKNILSEIDNFGYKGE